MKIIKQLLNTRQLHALCELNKKGFYDSLLLPLFFRRNLSEQVVNESLDCLVIVLRMEQEVNINNSNMNLRTSFIKSGGQEALERIVVNSTNEELINKANCLKSWVLN